MTERDGRPATNGDGAPRGERGPVGVPDRALREMPASRREVEDIRPLWDSLIVSIEEGFVACDAELRYQIWNPFMERITGIPAADVLGRRAVDVFPELRGHAIQALLRRALNGEAVTSPDTPFRVPQTGRKGWLVIRYLPWWDADGKVQGAVGLVRDITERRASEEALVRSEHELSLHNRIADVFLTCQDDQMFEEVLEILLEEMESEHGMFGFLDAEGNLVVPAMTKGVFAACRMEEKTTVFPRSMWGGAWGNALHDGCSVLLNGPGQVPEGHIPIHRALCTPISNRGDLIGLLVVANRKREYTSEDRERLEHIASHVGPILHARLQRDLHEEERARVERDLRHALAEKELLLKEVHHRVKNNMAVISSMLRLQSDSVADQRARLVFDIMRQRIKTMALVHEQLYCTGEFSSINLREYLEKVVHTLSQSHLGHRPGVEVRTQCSDLRVDIDCAIPSGLIVTELVSNALQHAFPGARRGVVMVMAAVGDDGWYELTVRDDGVGIPDDVARDRSRGFGLEMVGLLAKQLGGVLEMRGGTGTEVSLRFPLQAQ